MPLWNDLGKALASELADYSPSGALDAISAYEHEFGRARLVERLMEVLHLKHAEPGEAHREFCLLPFDIVCTTNFDFLLERQYGLLSEAVHPVVDEDQLSINTEAAGTILLKLHGDLRHPKRLVVTEADYDGFLTNYPLLATYLSNQLITKTAVFIGYSLDDPDFRQIWHVVSSRLGKSRRMAYAIVVNASPGDVARFERRGVKVVNLPGSKDRYGQVLADAFRELGEYRRDKAPTAINITEEEPLREFLLPRDSATRLCFFSLPLDVLPFYRERVFPVAEAAGLVPVSATDVISAGDSIRAKIDTLIDRAAVMIVEISSRWTRVELGMAISRAKETDTSRPHRASLELVLVVGEGEQAPAWAEEFRVIRRPGLVSTSIERFVEQLSGVLLEISAGLGFSHRSEPRRLLNAREYRAAIIAAMSLFESVIRRRLGKEQWPVARRFLSLRDLFQRAVQMEIVPEASFQDIEHWIQLRNEVVHTTRNVTKAEAQMVVEGVENIVSTLQ